MGFLVILKIPVTYFQELFTESKKNFLLSRGDIAKLGCNPKSYTFWAPSFFSIAKVGKSYSFLPRLCLGPNFWPSCCISWVLQTLFGNLAIFLILGHFRGAEVEKLAKIGKKWHFCIFGTPKMAQNQEIGQIPK